MANKTKIINVAQKYIQKGQYDRAIKELERLIEEDPRDVRTLLKIGDIHSKKGDKAQATEVYRKVADFYSEQGFFLKAVAVHKQILKYDPQDVTVTTKLAELYEHLGLMQEAMAQYQGVASLHESAGRTKDALALLRRMVELDPDNVASRVRLAESFSREGLVEDAVEQFSKAAEILRLRDRTGDYIKVAERLIYHDPSRLDVVKELARTYLSVSDTKRALAKLQLAFKAEPHDVETLTMLAESFRTLGQNAKTIFVYRELTKVYQETGRIDEARAVSQKILELEPEDPDARATMTAQSGRPMGRAQAQELAAPALAPPRLAKDVAKTPALGSPRQWTPDQGVAEDRISGSDQWAEPRGAREATEDWAQDRGRANADAGELPPPVLAARSARPAPAGEAPTERPQSSPTPPEMSKLLTETDVFIKYGLREKAVEHLQRVLQLDPQSITAYRKMRDVYLTAGDTARAAEAMANVVWIHSTRGEAGQMEQARQELMRLAPGHPVAQPRGAGPSIPPSEDSIDIDVDDDFGVDEPLPGDEPFEVRVSEPPELLDEPIDEGDILSSATNTEEVAARPVDEVHELKDLAENGSSDGLDEAVHGLFEPQSDTTGRAAKNPLVAGAWGEEIRGAPDPEDSDIFAGNLISAPTPESEEPIDAIEEVLSGDFEALDDPMASGPRGIQIVAGLVPSTITEAEIPTDEVVVPARVAQSPVPFDPRPEPPEPLGRPEPAILDGGAAGDSFGNEIFGAESFLAEPEPPAQLESGLESGIEPGFEAGLEPEPSAEEGFSGLAEELEGFGDDALLSGLSDLSEDESDGDAEDALDEVEFLIQQGLFEEAREEIVGCLRRHPLYGRAVAMLDQVEARLGIRTEGNDAGAPVEFLAPAESFAEEAQSAGGQGAADDATSGTGQSTENPVATAAYAYEDGIARYQDGDLVGAIGRFQEASADPASKSAAYTMIGRCLVLRNDLVGALGHFVAALEATSDPAQSELLKEEIGGTYEAAGDHPNAIAWFRSAFGSNPQNHELRQHIEAIGGSVDDLFPSGPSRGPQNGSAPMPTLEDNEPPVRKKSKITYL